MEKNKTDTRGTPSALPLREAVWAAIASSASPEGVFTFIYDTQRKAAKGFYSQDGSVKEIETKPSELVVSASIPDGFRNKHFAVEALYRIVVSKLAGRLPELTTQSSTEDSLRREIRVVRDFAIHASELGLAAEEAFFDDILVSLKKTLQPLVETRQEKINEQQYGAWEV